MFELTLVQLAEPIGEEMGVWQLRDGQHILGHLLATREGFEPLVDGLKLLAAANSVRGRPELVIDTFDPETRRAFSVIPFEAREQPLLGQEPS